MGVALRIPVKRLLPHVASALAHAGAVALIAFLTVDSFRFEAPGVAVSVPRPAPFSMDTYEPVAPVEFIREVELQAKIEVEEVPVDFQPDHEIVEKDPVLLFTDSPARPEPVLDRPVSEKLSQVRLRAPESVPQVVTETAAEEFHNPAPDYPSAARRRGIEGVVVVEIEILADGTCGDAKVVQDADFRGFGESALSAVRSWKYRPATRDGVAVSSTQRVRFVFRIKK
jgi:protein TonB